MNSLNLFGKEFEKLKNENKTIKPLNKKGLMVVEQLNNTVLNILVCGKTDWTEIIDFNNIELMVAELKALCFLV